MNKAYSIVRELGHRQSLPFFAVESYFYPEGTNPFSKRDLAPKTRFVLVSRLKEVCWCS